MPPTSRRGFSLQLKLSGMRIAEEMVQRSWVQFPANHMTHSGIWCPLPVCRQTYSIHMCMYVCIYLYKTGNRHNPEIYIHGEYKFKQVSKEGFNYHIQREASWGQRTAFQKSMFYHSTAISGFPSDSVSTFHLIVGVLELQTWATSAGF